MASTGSTIPYHLRPHKAIDRNLFIAILRRLDRYRTIDIDTYKYIGFGAPFLDDFKTLHLEFGITKMDCVEMNESAFSRQQFNNPYRFLRFFKEKSTDYIVGEKLKIEVSKIIWWDYTDPNQLDRQLRDLEYTAAKCKEMDILRFTFVAGKQAYVTASRSPFEKAEDECRFCSMLTHHSVSC